MSASTSTRFYLKEITKFTTFLWGALLRQPTIHQMRNGYSGLRGKMSLIIGVGDFSPDMYRNIKVVHLQIVIIDLSEAASSKSNVYFLERKVT